MQWYFIRIIAARAPTSAAVNLHARGLAVAAVPGIVGEGAFGERVGGVTGLVFALGEGIEGVRVGAATVVVVGVVDVGATACFGGNAVEAAFEEVPVCAG